MTVEGVIWGANGCTTAEVVDVDTSADTLALTVRTREAKEGTACTQAIVEIEYRATSRFQHGIPGTTTVTHVHDGERVQVAEATPTASEPRPEVYITMGDQCVVMTDHQQKPTDCAGSLGQRQRLSGAHPCLP